MSPLLSAQFGQEVTEAQLMGEEEEDTDPRESYAEMQQMMAAIARRQQKKLEG